jgi:hypothetical protein
MTDFSKAYDSLTDESNNFITTQLNQKSIWNAIPGSLNKVSTSSLGFAWGIDSSKVYYCQLPCSGQWNNVPINELPLDIATDESNVYILSSNNLFIKSANNQTDWLIIKVPFSTTQIFSTSSYIWIQDSSGKKARLPKPGTTSNWSLIQDTNKISSSNQTSLFSINSQGQIMKTDESLNSGWYTIPDYEGSKFSNLLESSNALYGMSSDNKLNRCSDNKCDIVDTQGMNPSSLSMEPTTKSLWMTTTNEGSIGNIFNKQDSIDYSSTMKTINDIEEKRDQIKHNIELESEKNKNTSFIITELRKLKTFFDEFFKNKPREIPKNLKSQVIEINSQVEQLQNAMPIIQKVLFYIIIAALIYFFGSFLGFLSTLLVFGVLAYGIYDIYFLVNKVNE